MSPCEDLTKFADGELDPERAAAFREHLKTCDACPDHLVEALQLRARLSNLSRSGM
jgi:cellulose synthase operon protein C